MTQNADKSDALDAAASAVAFHHRQVEMMSEVVQLALGTVRVIATRQSEAVSEFHRFIADAASRCMAPATVEDRIASNLDFAKRAFGTGISHSIALTELAVKMEMDALTILNKNVSAALDGAASKAVSVKK